MGVNKGPFYLLGPPLLVLVSVPLAIFACLTTILALSLLAIRVSFVYLDFGAALIQTYTSAHVPRPLPMRSQVRAVTTPPRYRSRNGSTASHDGALRSRLRHSKAGSSASLHELGSPSRDFEGVGGWRLYEGEEEAARWHDMNKRLELSLSTPRRHQRRHTADGHRWVWTPEAFRMSPILGRKSSQSELHDAEEREYFPFDTGLRPLRTATEPVSPGIFHSRRPSMESSLSSSMLQRRQENMLKRAKEVAISDN